MIGAQGRERRARDAGAGARLALLALAALLVGTTLLGLGGSGLWEPGERAVAEAAVKALGQGQGQGRGQPEDARWQPGAGLQAALPAIGLALFGASEKAARLPGALLALVAALLVLLAGRRLYGGRQGWWAAWLLATMPAFVLGARQLTSESPLLCALALSMLGLGGAAVSAPGPRRLGHLAAGGAGLALGALAGGLLLGTVVPALAAGLARLLAGGTRAPEGTAALRSTRTLAWMVGAGALLGLGLFLLLPYRAGELSWRLGGMLHAGTSATSFDSGLGAFGFGVFPLAPLAFFALMRPFTGGGESPEATTPDRPPVADRFADLFLLLLAGLGLAAGTLRAHLTGQVTLAYLPAVALAMGRFIEERRQAGSSQPLLAVLLAGGAIMVARDLGHTPVELVSVHLGDARSSPLPWPPTLEVRAPLLAAGLATALWLALLALGPPAEEVPGPRRRITDRTGALLRRARRWAPLGLLVSQALLALWLAHAVIPGLGRHLSPSRLFASYQRLRPPAGAPLAIYAGATLPAPWAREPPAALASLPALGEALRDRPGPFVIVPRAELGRIDHHLGQQGIGYAVADASSSHLLLLARDLPAGAADQNPLTPLRWRPSAGTPRPWGEPRLARSATFGGAIQLRGADYPAVVRRSGGLTIALHFEARQPPPPDHHVFVHLERQGTLLNGDHPPLQGIYPTTLWLPGDQLLDRHHIPLPFVLTPAGSYRIHVGFWPGGNTDRRLPVTEGDHDGRQRVYLGTVEIR